jgi:hypothetical protein
MRFVWTAALILTAAWVCVDPATAEDICLSVASLDRTGFVGVNAAGKPDKALLLTRTNVRTATELDGLLTAQGVANDDETIAFVKSLNPQVDDFASLKEGQTVWVPSFNKDFIGDQVFSVAKFKEFAPKLVPAVAPETLSELQGALSDLANSDTANGVLWGSALSLASGSLDDVLTKPDETNILAFNAYVDAEQKLRVLSGSTLAAQKAPEGAYREEAATLVLTTLAGFEKDSGSYRDPVNIFVRSVDADSRQPKPGYRVYYATGYSHDLGCSEQTKRPFPALTQSENLLPRGIYWMWIEGENQKTDALRIDTSLNDSGTLDVDIMVGW